jgi:hypothetical protein
MVLTMKKKKKKQIANKKYYEKNKLNTLNQKKQKIECRFCNSIISKNDIKKHMRTMKCIQYQKFIDDSDSD